MPIGPDPASPPVAPFEPPNPLRRQHADAGAEFQPYAAAEIVSTFGEPEAEYAAIRKGCALLDFPQRGILEVSGRDRLAFLNNLLSNETWNKSSRKGLEAGAGVYAFFLNLKGRIVADVNLLERGDRCWLETDARYVEPLRLAFTKYLFGERVEMTGRIGALHQFALHGPGAPALLDAASGSALAALVPMGSSAVRLFDVDGVVWRDDACGAPGLNLLVPSESAPKLWTALVSRFGAVVEHGKRPLRPAGWAAFNAARVENGRPIFGIDFDESVLPAELGPAAFDRAVSVTKGCYLGQEIVARMHARKQVARQLVGLRVEGGHLPIAGASLYDEQRNVIGGVTSSTVSPVLSGAAIAMGYLKKPWFEAGAVVDVPAEGALRKATVVTPPFI